MTDSILTTVHSGWTEICLNRPDRLNAFNDEMHEQLATSMQVAAEDSSVRCVLLTGSGRGFCAGQDLSARDPRSASGPPDLHHTLSTQYNPLIKRIRSMDKPVVCAVNGVAAGAGANIALACDIVLAADSAKFIQSFAKVGLVPDAGGSWHLTHLLGIARAKALALTAEPVSATTAEQWGLIWKCLPNDDLMPQARALAEQFATGPTIGLAQTKHAINAAVANTLDAQLDLEAKVQGERGRSSDYAEGVAAFLEKRAPQFTSKGLGIVLERVSPGEADASLTVESRHLNGHRICHGGFIFTLADTAFAFACNTYNQAAVAQQNSITFAHSGRPGAKLTAYAKEVSRHGRSGIYDVNVVDDEGVVIAYFRGHSRTIKGTLFDEADL